MRLKLDENIGRRGLELLKASGHDVMTVWDQGLRGDRDFGQVTRFPPERSAGIVVLDVGPRTTLQGIISRLQDFLVVLENQSVAGALWIIESGRVRVHLRDEER